MNHFIRKSTLLLTLASLSACNHPGQNRYGYQDVGQATVVKFGTVVSERAVSITGENTGLGATIGAAGGAIGGSAIGRGSGSLGAMLAGAVIAGVAGAATEQAISDRSGIEYVITLEKGDTITLVQNYVERDPSIKIGQRVMVQTSGMYQRVLPAENLPEKIKRPKKIQVED
jgi:outer membrane lipoprotein SlyB